MSKDVAVILGEVAVGDQFNTIFSGTEVTDGRAKAVVVATGMKTEMDKVAGSLEATTQEPTHLQEELDHLGIRLAWIVVGIAVIIIGTILLTEEISGLSTFFEVLIIGVALAATAVPEGMPTMVIAVLALGLQRMAKV